LTLAARDASITMAVSFFVTLLQRLSAPFRAMLGGLSLLSGRQTLSVLSHRCASLLRPQMSSTSSQQVAQGIDCTCFYTDNIFVSAPLAGHYCFHDDEQFGSDYAEQLARLSSEDRELLLTRIKAEVTRRRNAVGDGVRRKQRIESEYQRLHPRLWTLSEEFLHEDFVRMVRGEGPLPAELVRDVYALPVFTPRFCEELCEELLHFASSGLPMGRPNSMNNEGMLLEELGLSDGLIRPLVEGWLQPLCMRLSAELARAAAGLDHRKAFVVRYRLGEDEHLATHFDNAEVTLNANLGLGFEGGELTFLGRHDLPLAYPHYHAWDAGVGHAVLHLGREMHNALPITEGERLNLVVWMRSTAYRRAHGCPMCDGTDRLIAQPEAATGRPQHKL